jgi:AraC family transcriptional regulator, regulatory protein of adaptative response / methylated-DNA-[protein]-cysteine methyltransferase
VTSAASLPTFSALSATRQWRAVQARDRRFDGTFVYAVRSTGIYCRPSCPSRRPRRTQVRFFPIPEAAEALGFRPCRRCRPATRATDPDVALVRDLCQALAAQPDRPLGLAALAQRAGSGVRYVARAFRRVLGVSPRQYQESLRVRRLKTELKGRRMVSPAIYEAGYGSSSRVYERSNAELGMTPAVYARGGAGARIAYAIAPSPLGQLLVAATERGVCHIALGDDPERLSRGLRAEFPAAEIRGDEARIAAWTRAVVRYLEGREPHLDLPLDLRATAFQRQVWSALRNIPYGATRSYSEVARAIGRPRAVRAVAQACAANPVPLVIPCHRVIDKDGNVGGYRWGAERKRKLLAMERGPGA